MAGPLALKYRAFISYSHRDTTWAKRLQRGLEGFKIDKDLAGKETARGSITVLHPRWDAPPLRFRRLDGSWVVAVSDSGAHAFLLDNELTVLQREPEALEPSRLAELESKFFVPEGTGSGMRRLLGFPL